MKKKNKVTAILFAFILSIVMLWYTYLFYSYVFSVTAFCNPKERNSKRDTAPSNKIFTRCRGREKLKDLLNNGENIDKSKFVQNARKLSDRYVNADG